MTVTLFVTRSLKKKKLSLLFRDSVYNKVTVGGVKDLNIIIKEYKDPTKLQMFR